MTPFDLIAFFGAGVFLTNAIPHAVSGLTGRRFPSPFAKPPGVGLSGPTTNVLWGGANAAIGYWLISHVSAFDPQNYQHVIAIALGAFLTALALSAYFRGVLRNQT